MAFSIRIGAGGRWPVFDETLDPNVVKQQSQVSCGPACGEMLFRDRGIKITQDIIEQASFAPMEAKDLATVLNKLDPSNTRLWKGGGIVLPGASDELIIKTLNHLGSWAAILWEQGASMGHLVVIDGFDNYGRLMVRDPWEGTSYKMKLKEFLRVWAGTAIFPLS